MSDAISASDAWPHGRYIVGERAPEIFGVDVAIAEVEATPPVELTGERRMVTAGEPKGAWGPTPIVELTGRFRMITAPEPDAPWSGPMRIVHLTGSDSEGCRHFRELGEGEMRDKVGLADGEAQSRDVLAVVDAPRQQLDALDRQAEFEGAAGAREFDDPAKQPKGEFVGSVATDAKPDAFFAVHAPEQHPTIVDIDLRNSDPEVVNSARHNSPLPVVSEAPTVAEAGGANNAAGGGAA